MLVLHSYINICNIIIVKLTTLLMTLLVIIDIYLLSTWVNTINTINTNINIMYVVISYTICFWFLAL